MPLESKEMSYKKNSIEGCVASPSETLKFISIYFNFDEESNLPSLYSSLALGFCSYLLAIIATLKKKVKTKYAKHWQALAWIFLYLAIDEICSIHELLNPILKRVVNAKGLLYFPWIIPAFCLVIIFLVVFFVPSVVCLSQADFNSSHILCKSCL